MRDSNNVITQVSSVPINAASVAHEPCCGTGYSDVLCGPSRHHRRSDDPDDLGRPFYHTSGEVPDLVPNAGLERAARFHAYMIAAADAADPALLKGAPWTPKAGCPAIP